MSPSPQRSSEGGFTLVELLVVLVILAVTAGIAAIAVTGTSKSSAQSACTNDLRTVQAAIDSYRTEMGIFPTAGQFNIPSGTIDVAPFLLQSYTSGGITDGPWLRQAPSNGTHYTINVASGTGVVTVTDSTGSGHTSCSAVS